MNIAIPKDFLDGEVRDGFYVERMMKRNWACMIKMLSEVDRICEKYGISYFADWGTLLGCIRHGGFVPWDDDVDITMKRNDYIKFCQVAPDEFPKDWKLLNIHTDASYTQMLARIVSGSRIDCTPEHLKEYCGYPFVTGIDIFPLDYLAPTDEEDAAVCEILRTISWSADVYESGEGSDEEREELLKSIEEMCSAHIDRSGNIGNQLRILQEKVSMMYTEEESDRIALMPDHAGPRANDVYPKAYYAKSVRMKFEYITLPVPIGYKDIIVQKYGTDWNVPYLCSANHNYPCYKPQQKVLWQTTGTPFAP